MAKYSYEFKKQVVEAYLSGEGGYEYLAIKIPTSNRQIIGLTFWGRYMDISKWLFLCLDFRVYDPTNRFRMSVSCPFEISDGINGFQ